MWSRIAILIANALKDASPAILKAAAQALGRLVRENVPASMEGILKAAEKYAAENPTKLALVMATLTDAGVKVAWNAIESIFGGGQDGPTSAVLLEIQQREQKRMKEITGDGDPDTVHGYEVTELTENAEVVKLAINRVRTGVRLFGSLEAFQAAREAILLTEEQDFAIYQTIITNG